MIVGVGLIVAMLAGAGALLWSTWSNQPKPKWMPVPGVQGAQCVVPPSGGPTTNDVGKCLAMAGEQLARAGCWPRDVIAAALSTTSVIVTQLATWTEARTGQSIGGESQGYVMSVDRGMTSMCHELAHVLEWHTTRVQDADHTSWTLRGIWKADEAYRSWLAAG